jgi:hypothetical protein
LKHLVSIFQSTDFLSVNFGSKRYVCFALLLRVLSFFLFDHEGEGKAKKLNTKIIGEIGIDSKITTEKLLALISAIASDSNLLTNLNNNDNNPSATASTSTTVVKKKEVVKNENEYVFSNCLILLAVFVASYQDCLFICSRISLPQCRQLDQYLYQSFRISKVSQLSTELVIPSTIA